MDEQKRVDAAAKQKMEEQRPLYNAEKIADLRRRVRQLEQDLQQMRERIREAD